jgi:sterol desaturase/sphingolipid hydroxylase (fatty acid hydroxylase superfamily)
MSEWLTVFERFPTGRVPIVGPIGILVHDWSKPVDGHPRVFDHPAIEGVTTASPRSIGAVYSAIAIAMFSLSVYVGLSPSRIAASLAAGVVAWSFFEYLMHRYAFHYVPRTRLGLALAYLSHGVHHAYPHDPDRLVVPLVVSLPVSILFLAAGYGAAGVRAFPFLSGFAVGYLAYDLIHYHVHYGTSQRGPFKWLRRYHLQHHFSTPDRQFGVSSPIWDYVFRTGR